MDGLISIMLVGAAIIAVIGLVEGGSRVAPEVGAVMALMLPFAIHMGRFAVTRPLRHWLGLTGAVMVVALVTAMSGIALLALAVMLIVMIPAWNWRTRANLLAPSVLALAALVYLVPELPGSVVDLFTGTGDGLVAVARASWAPLMESAWPAGYWIVGVSAIAVLHFGAFVMAAIAFSRSVMLADRHLCACLMATQVMALMFGFTFAPLGLGTYSVFIAVVTGACAAMWRITAPRVRRPVREAEMLATPGGPR